MNPNDNDGKMLDRELRDFPVPPPPAGLLQKIQAEILASETLAGKNSTAVGAPRRWPLRLSGKAHRPASTCGAPRARPTEETGYEPPQHP